MTGDGHRPIPLWATSRGLHVMVRMALSQQGRSAVPAATLAEFRKALDETRSRVVIVAAEDLFAGGLDPVLLERLVGDGTAVVLLSAVRPLPDPPGPRTRVLPVPFTARDLLDAVTLAPEPTWPARGPDRVAPDAPHVPPPAAQPQAPVAVPPPVLSSEAIADRVRQEVERLVSDIARQVVDEVARRVVPELAETMIREELARMLKESDEAALGGPGGPDDDR